MDRDTSMLRRGTNVKQTCDWVESSYRFVAHFKTNLLGGHVANVCPCPPLKHDRRVHARKLSLLPQLAVFQIRAAGGHSLLLWTRR